jgi:putative redox protein
LIQTQDESDGEPTMSDRDEGTVELGEGMSFSAISGSGHTITLDAATDVGGADRGPRPMELLLLGLGGCTGMKVISILRKMRQPVTAYQVQTRGERAATHPRVYTDSTVEHRLRGPGRQPPAVHRAAELSATRYCSAAAMLGRVARIVESYRVVDETTGIETAGTVASPGEDR